MGREASVLSSDNLIWTKNTSKANEIEARLVLWKLFPIIQRVRFLPPSSLTGLIPRYAGTIKRERFHHPCSHDLL